MKYLLCLILIMVTVLNSAQAQVYEFSGAAAFGEPVSGSHPERAASHYELYVTPDEYFTLRLTAQDTAVFLYEIVADGSLGATIRYHYEGEHENEDVFVFRAGEAESYHVVIWGEGDYTFVTEAGDTVRQWQEPVAIGETITGNLAAGQALAYELLIDDGGWFGIWRSPDEYSSVSSGRGWVNGTQRWELENDNENLWFYRANHPGPYTLTITEEGPYSFRLEGSDRISQFAQPLALGDTVTATINPGQMFAADLQIPLEQEFTLRVDPSPEYASIASADNNATDLHIEWEKALAAVYRLDEPDDYSLVIEGEGEYVISLEADDAVRGEKQIIHVGDTVTGNLDSGEITYELQGIETEFFTLRYDNPSVEIEVVDFDGAYINSQGGFGITTTDIYRVFSDQPHTLTLYGGGDYTLTIEPGDTLRQLMGPIDAGETVTGTLTEGQLVTYDLLVNRNEAFSLRIAGDVFPTIYTGHGLWVDPQFVETMRGTDEQVLVFPGDDDLPISLTLDGEGDFAFTMEHGDILRTIRGPLTPGQTVSGTLSEGQIDAYEIQIEEGQYFTLHDAYGNVSKIVVDGLGNDRSAQYSTYGDSSGLYEVYIVQSQPYTLSLVGEGDYQLTLEAGDTLRDSQPVISLGDSITGEVANGQVMVYPLQTTFGDNFFTIRSEGIDRSSWDVIDADGNQLAMHFEPEGLSARVYRGSDFDLPMLTINGQTEYAFVIEAGDTVREVGETLLHDTPMTKSYVDTPGEFRHTVYEMQAEPGQPYALQISAAGSQEFHETFDIFVATVSSGFEQLAESEEIEFDPETGTYFIERVYPAPGSELVMTISTRGDGDYTILVTDPSEETDDAETEATGQAGACIASASNNVNQRSGPGTGFDVAGVLAAGESILVEGQSTDGDNFVWWRLETGAWVRSDVVTTQGECENVPEAG